MATPSPVSRRLSAEKVESNDELLTKILLFEPENTLVQFKLVCKRWFALISDPYFCSLYATSKSTPSIFFSLYPSSRVYKLLYYLVPLTSSHVAVQKGIRYGDIKSSCNGLVVFKFGKDLFVCNPTTNFVTQLPLHINLYHPNTISLAFDSSLKSPHYKVIVIRHDISSSVDLDIYSSKSNEWKYSCARLSFSSDDWAGVYWNGAFHWLTRDNVPFFNVDEEKFGSIARPLIPNTCSHKDVLIEYTGESNGYLHLVQVFTGGTERETSSVLCIHQISPNSSKWNLVHQSCFDVVLDLFPQNFKQLISSRCKYEEGLLVGFERFRFILLLLRGKKENEIVLVLQILDKDGEVSQVIRYDIMEQSFQVLDLPRVSSTWRRAFPYIESLASPFGDQVASPTSTYRMCVKSYVREVAENVKAMFSAVHRKCFGNGISTPNGQS